MTWQSLLHLWLLLLLQLYPFLLLYLYLPVIGGDACVRRLKRTSLGKVCCWTTRALGRQRPGNSIACLPPRGIPPRGPSHQTYLSTN